MTTLNHHHLTHELIFTTSRSSGPGGQNVNKVNSKVTLKWDVQQSNAISDEQREILLVKLKTYLTKEGVLLLSAQEKRSQLQNKEEALQKLDQLLKKAFAIRKARKATKPSKAATYKRIQEKKQRGEKKQWRKKID
ncbi:MAG TPA: alternative ribosome rescue aminoacyl-tRNA hydrolase ArfB [Cyclobacteriaceae bacterium]|nr:alternative ribosome rescue aminoacyl-tRNA hydrolase ArfB [Cyclobacteriaceae bacterium]HRJ83087.1 alternative ribosome rescue aminoacyl-tRNA hydrolase ArfB [Cyclobacteriaceae bacterium]